MLGVALPERTALTMAVDDRIGRRSIQLHRAGPELLHHLDHAFLLAGLVVVRRLDELVVDQGKLLKVRRFKIGYRIKDIRVESVDGLGLGEQTLLTHCAVHRLVGGFTSGVAEARSFLFVEIAGNRFGKRFVHVADGASKIGFAADQGEALLVVLLGPGHERINFRFGEECVALAQGVVESQFIVVERIGDRLLFRGAGLPLVNELV